MEPILIVHQHGKHRGDEATMNAMLARIERELGAMRFTRLSKFRDRTPRPTARQQVDELPILLPPRELQKRAQRSTELAVEPRRQHERSRAVGPRAKRVPHRLETEATGPLA